MDEITTVKNQVKFAGWISMVEECQSSEISRLWGQVLSANYTIIIRLFIT